jgi:hypothetical protein
MTPEIREGNKLIAEFMNHPYLKVWRKFNDVKPFDFDKLKYHTSWGWLMPACKKWDELDPVPAFEEYMELSDNLDNKVTLYEILPVYKQLVENIKWYNKNNHP